jgi:hypothetical protein
MGEPTALALFDKCTIPPRTFGIFSRMRFDHYIFDKTQINIPLTFVREQSSDPES